MQEKARVLSICITSYNRVGELERCLKSIDCKEADEIEVVVSEDCSPMRENIRQVVADYAKCCPYKVVFNANEQNLGYDRNLYKLSSLASGEFIMYLSDDDRLFSGKFDEVLTCVKKQRPALAYSAFWFGTCGEKKEVRRMYDHSHIIPAGELSAGKRVYDSILFSGLIFKKELVLDIDPSRFVNSNFFQVYLFLDIIYRHGGYYQNALLIDCVSDGENAFGRVASSGVQNELLADRDSVFSKLEFQKGLMKVIRMFDADHGTNVFKLFSKEYSLRSFSGLYIARKESVSSCKEYWRRMKAMDISLHPVCYIYYVSLMGLGAKACRQLYALPKFVLKKVRRYY